MYDNERGLKDEFIKSINSKGRIEHWEGIQLEVETGKKLGKGFKGYRRTLEIIFGYLRDYAGHQCWRRPEAFRLLNEARQILEYRQNFTTRTGKTMDTKHRNVIKLWEKLLESAVNE